MSLKPFFSNLSLRTRLITWFLLIALLPLGWMTFISYELSRKILLDQATQNLKAISHLQAIAIENYFLQKQKEAISLSKSDSTINPIRKFHDALIKYGKDSEEYKNIQQKYTSILSFKTQTLGFSNLFLISKEGEIVFSALPSNLLGANLYSEPFQNSQLKEIFEEAKNLLESQISSFTYFHPLESPAAFISAPALNHKEQLEGVILVQIDNADIYKLTMDYNGLGESGETFLVTEAGGKLILQSPLRYNKEANFIRYISPHSPLAAFAVDILNGKRLVSKVIDYRGNETLMVGRYLLPTLHWTIITKIDVDELLAPINHLKIASLLMALITAAFVIFAAVRVAYSITHPILVMTKKTRLMAAGDLSQHIDIEGNNEVGRLAKSYNEMANQLKNMIQHLDTIVANRTEEVDLQNLRLENTIEELKQTQNRLISQEKLASLGALTAGIAHEIKNPLNFINNFAELCVQIETELHEHIEKLKNIIPEDEFNTLQEYLSTMKMNLDKIYEHGKKSDSIIHNMLQHSREGIVGERVVTDLNALINEYTTLSYHGMRAQDSTFNVKIEKNLDPTLPPVYLVPQEISRVILNLLNNAYFSVHLKKKNLGDDYTPIVKITTEHLNNLAIIKIWDNGQGISPEVFPKLFTPFFTTKPSGEGTGLGLSISYNIIVQGHQGSLTADSEEGEFAEFIITLPIKK